MLKEAYDLLKEKSGKWDAIGREFDISLNDRDTIRNSSLDDCGRLEHVLNLWLERDDDCTWGNFMKILRKNLQFNDIARKTETFLTT